MRATVRGASGTSPFHSALIEQVVTEKHARAWSTFLDSEADVLVVLEDDAVVPEGAAAQLAAILADDRIDARRLLYLDLAGGFPLRKLCEPSVLEHLGGGLIRIRSPFGNTTCGYAISRPLAAAMLTELTWDPVLRRIGPDWLVNELMMRIHKRTPIDCIHTEPTILGHGSFLGTHESHIQTRPPQEG